MDEAAAMVKKFRCPSCRQTFLLPRDGGSTRVVCPHCKQEVRTGSESTRTDPLIGKRFLAYKVLRRLGRGSMGRVYEVEDDRGQHLALKILSSRAKQDPELLERFKREARLTCKMRHPNLIAGYDTGEEHKAHYLVMELALGTALDKRLDRDGPLSWEEVLDVTAQIASALAYLADLGVVHRDVKPENIMLTEEGSAKLLDMGFAKTLGSGEMAREELKELTLVGTALGSPAYMAPEQVVDSSQATVATDIYSLGASCYHALTGQLPFNGKSAMAVMEQVLHDPLTPPREVEPSIPAGVDTLVVWMMAKEARQRPRSAARLEEVLAAVRERPEDERRVRRAGREGRLLRVALILLGLGALAALAYLAGERWWWGG